MRTHSPLRSTDDSFECIQCRYLGGILCVGMSVSVCVVYVWMFTFSRSVSYVWNMKRNNNEWDVIKWNERKKKKIRAANEKWTWKMLPPPVSYFRQPDNVHLYVATISYIFLIAKVHVSCKRVLCAVVRYLQTFFDHFNCIHRTTLRNTWRTNGMGTFSNIIYVNIIFVWAVGRCLLSFDSIYLACVFL